jgi:hypothetical protein
MKSTENAGNVSFTIKDANSNPLFKSNTVEKAEYYDFTSESTQQLTIEMMAAETRQENESSASQCVVVLVGQKE